VATSDSQFPIGLKVPFVSGTNGYFQQSFDTNDKVKQNLMNFLKTKKGERRMMPEFGTKLYNVLFEQKDGNFNSIAKNIISEEIKYWIPEISIQDIQIINVENPIGDDNYKLRISINFMVKQTKQLDNIIFELGSTKL